MQRNLLDSNLDEKSINKVISEIKNVKGVKTVLGLESVVGPMIPQSMIPQDLKSKLDNGEWKLMLVMSEYKVASDEVNTQCDEINTILHKYDSKAITSLSLISCCHQDRIVNGRTKLDRTDNNGCDEW